MANRSPAFYSFLLNMWIMRRITEEQLRVKVPLYLTQEECDMILAAPQAQ